jgi:hypothetical protein
LLLLMSTLSTDGWDDAANNRRRAPSTPNSLHERFKHSMMELDSSFAEKFQLQHD